MEIMLSDKSSSKNILSVGLNLDNVALDFTYKGEDLKGKISKWSPAVIPDSWVETLNSVLTKMWT